MSRTYTPRPAQQLRVVFDTNVYISAFTCPDSSLFTLWQAAVTKQYVLVSSPTILREFAGIMRDKFHISPETTAQYVTLIAHTVTLVQPKEVPPVVSADPDDDHILACAVVAHASLIVTGDNDLLRQKEHEGIAIVRPKDFVRILGMK